MSKRWAVTVLVLMSLGAITANAILVGILLLDVAFLVALWGPGRPEPGSPEDAWLRNHPNVRR